MVEDRLSQSESRKALIIEIAQVDRVADNILGGFLNKAENDLDVGIADNAFSDLFGGLIGNNNGGSSGANLGDHILYCRGGGADRVGSAFLRRCGGTQNHMCLID